VGVRFLCERLRKRLALADFRDESGASLPATISVGIAVLGEAAPEGAPAPGGGGESGHELDRLLAAADAALYEAKRRGKNSIKVAGEA
jgi:GGDEF domain-containing protein